MDNNVMEKQPYDERGKIPAQMLQTAKQLGAKAGDGLARAAASVMKEHRNLRHRDREHRRVPRERPDGSCCHDPPALFGHPDRPVLDASVDPVLEVGLLPDLVEQPISPKIVERVTGSQFRDRLAIAWCIGTRLYHANR